MAVLGLPYHHGLLVAVLEAYGRGSSVLDGGAVRVAVGGAMVGTGDDVRVAVGGAVVMAGVAVRVLAAVGGITVASLPPEGGLVFVASAPTGVPLSLAGGIVGFSVVSARVAVQVAAGNVLVGKGDGVFVGIPVAVGVASLVDVGSTVVSTAGPALPCAASDVAGTLSSQGGRPCTPHNGAPCSTISLMRSASSSVIGGGTGTGTSSASTGNVSAFLRS